MSGERHAGVGESYRRYGENAVTSAVWHVLSGTVPALSGGPWWALHSRDYRPSRDFTLLPKVQFLEPSQLIDQVIRPLIPLTLRYAWDTRLGDM